LTIATASDDNISYLLKYDIQSSKFEPIYTANQHNAAITSCLVHPIGNLYILGSLDGYFSYHDAN